MGRQDADDDAKEFSEPVEASENHEYSMRGHQLTEEQVDAVIETFENESDQSKKTWSRYIVENFLYDVSRLDYEVLDETGTYRKLTSAPCFSSRPSTPGTIQPRTTAVIRLL